MPRGGPRPNSGRPTNVRTFDDKTLKRLDKALAKKAKETGKSWEAVLVDIGYEEGTMQTARLGALKLIADIKGVIVKQSHKTVDEHHTVHGAPVILPPLSDDPAKLDMGAPAQEQRH